MIGSGPYRFLADEFVSGSLQAYAQFEGYIPGAEPQQWTAGAKVAHFERLEWLIIPDASTAAAALRSGEGDRIELVQRDLPPLLTPDANVTVHSYNKFGNLTALGFSYQNPSFNNLALCRAVRDAIQQKDFVEAIVGDDPGRYRLCQAMFGCDLPGVIEMSALPKT